MTDDLFSVGTARSLVLGSSIFSVIIVIGFDVEPIVMP
jgi:hypothetical protein